MTTPGPSTALTTPAVALPGWLVARVHTVLALAAFGSALVLGCMLHYKKIVKNGVAGWPKEWWPSVSATIGDWYPERSVFQILIALTAGPRFALVYMLYYVHHSTTLLVIGVLRTFMCGGWVYITSTDGPDVHDACMIAYVVLTLPWMIGGVLCSRGKARKWRRTTASAFFVSLVPLAYFYHQHKVKRIPGAYTRRGVQTRQSAALSVRDESSRRAARRNVCSNSPPCVTRLRSCAARRLARRTELKARTVPEISITAHPIPQAAEPPVILNWFPAFLRSLSSFMSDLYLAHTFWVVFSAVQPTLFYFSIWELAIAGPELAILSALSPALLGVRAIAIWAANKEGQITMHLLSLVAVASYVLSNPLHRLLLVTPATACVTLRQAALLLQDRKGYHSIIWLLGLLMFSLTKFANHSNNPVWPFVDDASGGWNKTGVILAVLACGDLYTRQTTADVPSRKIDVSAMPQPDTHWLAAALPLGSLVFILHAYLTEAGTLTAWAWTGWHDYQPSGPMSKHAALTLLAISAGGALALSSLCNEAEKDDAEKAPSQAQQASSTGGVIAAMLSHPAWYALGSAASFVMYGYRGWAGYAGSLVTAMFWASLVPGIVARAAATGKPGRTLGTAMFIYILMILANVWTVAYAFVPGGVYLRERTDLVMVAQTLLLAPAFAWSREARLKTPVLELPRTARLRAYATLAICCILGLATSLYRQPLAAPRPYSPGPRIITAGIWTVHFGFDNAGRDSQRLISELADDMRLDVLGLLETDLHRTVFGNRDLTRLMVEKKGYFVDIGPGPNKHTWGAVLLSKFPIKHSTHHLLPSPRGELAPAITAILDVWGTDVMVVVSHNGQKEDALDRQLQSMELGRLMAEAYPMPTIFLGYVVTKPHAPKRAPYRYLVEDGLMYDIDEDDKDRWCEYILYRGLYRTAYARVSRGTVTDTEMQIGQFVVPRHGSTTGELTKDERYLRSYREDLPVEHWFPDEYYGDKRSGGKNKHFYHVFDTPLYYRLPEGAHV
ncbi:Frag1/DRAM/Sfk1 family-domain-containing protein [Schizophyllum amplum]|uniref:Frag1/DRAM/Sfk1 family-domain-containing protein n=1 Tax=Schizophyllum amplum TaxID=97359 RepID=A0A550CPR3_9AGAR|nr:Frag1/DRAM/Sfk1 family-domain-containing protein [Auriculariopsis ampla]